MPSIVKSVSYVLDNKFNKKIHKRVVILGRSFFVGIPLMLLLLKWYESTCSVCHSKSKDFENKIK